MRAMVVAARASSACWVRVGGWCVPVWWVVVVRLRRCRLRQVAAGGATRRVSRIPGVWPSAGAPVAVPGGVAGVWGVVVMAWWAWSMGMVGGVPAVGAVAVSGPGWVMVVIMRAAAAMVRAW